jgi:ParB family chromosome partitioning protein
MVLGKGLAALLGEDHPHQDSLTSVNIHQLKPNPLQPRRYFDEGALKDLIGSIKEKGILQPILVRAIDEHHYQIIAGERRYRAAKHLGLGEVPIVVLECEEDEALEIGLIENLQRENLNPIEEAESIDRLMNIHQKTQEQISKSLGKSRSYVANSLRLMMLPDDVKQFVQNGDLSAGHARSLLGLDNASELAKQIVEQSLSVRDIEKIAKQHKQKITPIVEDSPSQIQQDMAILSERISTYLKIQSNLSIKKQKVFLTLEFDDWEKLDYLCQILQQNSL